MALVITLHNRMFTIAQARRQYPTIPDTTLDGIFRYVSRHQPPGGFIRAVLENNLAEAFGRADDSNRFALFGILRLLHNNVPSGCWGHPDKVNAWLTPE